MKTKLTALDRMVGFFSPGAAIKRARERAVWEVLKERHFEAATSGRRTDGWSRNTGDANAIANPRVLSELRMHARDLARNNGWAKKARRVIANNTVGWGITPKHVGGNEEKAAELWKAWAETTQCDAEGLRTFAGFETAIMRAVATDGEILVRRRWREKADGLAIPMQMQLIEVDQLDSTRVSNSAGRTIINGVEFDAIGRRTGYWVFPKHPGSNVVTNTGAESFFVRASEMLHVFEPDRPGQVRGVSWFGASIVNMKDLDEYEDATLLRQKIAAFFAAFVTDANGMADPMGEEDEDDDNLDKLEPGMISNLPPGKDVKFSNPPTVSDYDAFTSAQQRKIAAGLCVPFEELTGDYSKVNFSSARMSRIAHQKDVNDWRWNLLIPMFCEPARLWAMEAATFGSGLKAPPESAEWTCPPLPMIEPDKEGLAYSRLVRNGVMTPSDVVREQGGDPATHWEKYAEDMAMFDRLKLKLDCDPRATSQAGLTQERAGLDKGAPAAKSEADEETERAIVELAKHIRSGA